MPSIHEILKQYWGYDVFRPAQEEIIQKVIDGKDTFALLPTGGGKSLCFQIPGLYFGGLTIVISPLIALMKDQVENLEKKGIHATYINSSLPSYEIDRRLQGAMDGKYTFLYLAPERIGSQIFLQRLPAMKVSLIVVDEAHCISQWGYDFRPPYLEIHRLRKIKPNIPIIAVTASATPEVQKDILHHLQLKNPEIFVQSFKRDNLRYFVQEEQNVMKRILEIAKRTTGTGIVYVRTRKAAEAIAGILEEHTLSAAAYHGGLTHSERYRIQEDWIKDRKRIMVATNAFGMGIDKPDVRFVVHYQLSADLENYYQEAGRGGRDGKTALAIAFHNPADLAELARWVKGKYPEWEELELYFKALCNVYNVPNEGNPNVTHTFDIATFCQENNLSPKVLYNVVHLLHQEGFIYYKEEKEDYGYIQSACMPEDWVNFQKNTPSMKLIAEMIMRNLGGAIFQHEVPFLPYVWANALKVTPEYLEQQLLRLVQLKMIFYALPTNTPTLTFLKTRDSLTKNSLNWNKYLFLKQQAETRFEKIKSYITTSDTCRSNMIQRYFGEKDVKPCGKCDVCVSQRRTVESEKLHNEMLAFIRKSPNILYRDILHTFPKGNIEERKRILRYLLDKGLLESDVKGHVNLKN